jgi:hypothetical protein
MQSVFNFLILIFLLAFAVIAFIARVFIPYWVMQQLAAKDIRLLRILKKIPAFRISLKANVVERLMRKPQNKNYIGKNYPVAFHWYKISHKWWKRGAFVFVALIFISQALNIMNFASDPKGWREGADRAAQKYFSHE